MKISRYFIASEHNDYKPWILSTQALVVFCLVIWAIRLIVPASITLAAPAIDPVDVMNRINFERTQRFIPALISNADLTTAANGKAADMLARSYFAHVDPDGNYVWPRIEAAGYTPYLTLGENLAMDFSDAPDLMDAWMNSPTHRENILNDKFVDQGVASQYGTFAPGHDTIMVVSLFGALYVVNKPAKTTTPTPAPKTSTPTTVPKTSTTQPAPTTTKIPVTSAPSPVINPNINLSSTSLSGHTLINVSVLISGEPTLVTAVLKGQAITLLAGSALGQFVGSFTFDQTENLSNQTMTVEARSSSGMKVDSTFPINFPSQVSGSQSSQNTVQTTSQASQPVSPATAPVSSDNEIINILRIVFGVFAVIYMIFLIIDAIIKHRAKIPQKGINTSMHSLLFLLLAGVALFTRW